MEQAKDNIKVRRNIRSHVYHGLWMSLALYKTIDSQSPWQVMWGLLFIVSMAQLVKILINGSYLEKKGSRLLVNGDLFQTRTIEIADIERIEIEPGLFSNSRIILRNDQRKIKFNYQHVNTAEFNELVRSMNVPVN